MQSQSLFYFAAMMRMGLSQQEAYNRFWLVDDKVGFPFIGETKKTKEHQYIADLWVMF